MFFKTKYYTFNVGDLVIARRFYPRKLTEFMIPPDVYDGKDKGLVLGEGKENTILVRWNKNLKAYNHPPETLNIINKSTSGTEIKVKEKKEFMLNHNVTEMIWKILYTIVGSVVIMFSISTIFSYCENKNKQRAKIKLECIKKAKIALECKDL